MDWPCGQLRSVCKAWCCKVRWAKVDAEDEIVSYDSPCRHLSKDNKCLIYEERPACCRNWACGARTEEEMLERYQDAIDRTPDGGRPRD
jgi:Fe-S-cluster containining protein